MAFNAQVSSSGQNYQSPPFSGYGSSMPRDGRPNNLPDDTFEWHKAFASCYEYFINHAQHDPALKALAAFLNIRLPCQRTPAIITTRTSPHSPGNIPRGQQQVPYAQVPDPFLQTNSLIPYIRRLVATGNDTEHILFGFFGKDWVAGIGPHQEIERRNFLFAAKSTPWLTVKQSYDMGPDETIPFMSTLLNPTEQEIAAADDKWSEWLAMGDWMVGPRAPAVSGSVRVKREQE